MRFICISLHLLETFRQLFELVVKATFEDCHDFLNKKEISKLYADKGFLFN